MFLVMAEMILDPPAGELEILLGLPATAAHLTADTAQQLLSWIDCVVPGGFSDDIGEFA